jgi:hypothetical protein
MPDDSRLARIEKKLDQVSEAFVALARVEERNLTLFKRIDLVDSDRAAQGIRLSSLEATVGTNGQSLRNAERFFWIVVTAAIGFCVNYIF